MKHFLIIVVAVISTFGLSAQQNVTYFNHTQVGVFIGEESSDKEQKSLIPSFQTINGFLLDKQLGLGIGLGAEPFEYMTFPVFFGGYYFFNKLKNNPYLSIKVGHAFSNSHKKFNSYGYSGDYKHKGGLLFNPEVGVRLKTTNFDVTLSAGYRFQRLKSTASPQQSTHYTYEHQTEYNRVSFALGIIF